MALSNQEFALTENQAGGNVDNLQVRHATLSAQ
jgi:hypothetical protein